MDIVRAVLCYLTINGNILMLEKGVRSGDPNSRMYTQPGGKIDSGESSLAAICREFPQETGLSLINPSYAGTVFFDNTERTFFDMPATKHFMVHIYRASKYFGELRGTEEGNPVWIKKSEIGGDQKA